MKLWYGFSRTKLECFWFSYFCIDNCFGVGRYDVVMMSYMRNTTLWRHAELHKIFLIFLTIVQPKFTPLISKFKQLSQTKPNNIKLLGSWLTGMQIFFYSFFCKTSRSCVNTNSSSIFRKTSLKNKKLLPLFTRGKRR